MKKKKLLQLLSGALTAAILISGNGVAVAAQELNGTAGEYAQAEQTEEAAVQTEETEQTEEMTEQPDATKQSEEIAVQSDETEAVKETTEQNEETQTKTDELRQELLQLLEQKTVMATVYLTDLYEVREEPDADSAVEGSLPSGSQVLLKDVAIDGGSVWYYVMFAVDGQERYGYIDASHLVTSDTDFRAWEEKLGAADEAAGEKLKKSGNQDILAFPESYRAALTQLKASHPNWTFVPMQTNLEWSSVVSAEMQNNRSWVHQSKGDNWKAEAASQSGWYIASQAAVEYCLDPRNFTNDSYIFMFEQLTYNAQYHTVDAVSNIVSGSFMQGEVPEAGTTYAQAFYDIGNSLGVSPFFLACRVYQEQGSAGTSPLISGNYPGYEGYYNYYNIGATGTTTTDVYVNGLKTAQNKGWDTRMKALTGGAQYISQNYILKGQDTLYLQKFDVDASYNGLYSHQYQQNITAPMTEGGKIRRAYSQTNALENPFVFKIPVYNNMPATACPSPDDQDNTATAAALRAFVVRLYEDALGRTSYQDSEIDYWYQALRNGEKTGAEVAQGFFFSDEFKNKNLSNEAYVNLLYQVMFDRQADDSGKADWLAKLSNGMSREYVYRGFANSQEFANVCSQYSVIQGTVTLGSYRDQNEGVTSFVNRLYVKLLDRQGEDEGIENWCRTILTKADTTENVAHGFVFSQEFLNKNTSNEEFVKIMYRTFLDREYDQAGLNDWVGQLNSGVGREQVFHGFAGSTEFHNLMAEYGVD